MNGSKLKVMTGPHRLSEALKKECISLNSVHCSKADPFYSHPEPQDHDDSRL